MCPLAAGPSTPGDQDPRPGWPNLRKGFLYGRGTVWWQHCNRLSRTRCDGERLSSAGSHTRHNALSDGMRRVFTSSFQDINAKTGRPVSGTNQFRRRPAGTVTLSACR